MVYFQYNFSFHLYYPYLVIFILFSVITSTVLFLFFCQIHILFLILPNAITSTFFSPALYHTYIYTSLQSLPCYYGHNPRIFSCHTYAHFSPPERQPFPLSSARHVCVTTPAHICPARGKGHLGSGWRNPKIRSLWHNKLCHFASDLHARSDPPLHDSRIYN